VLGVLKDNGLAGGGTVSVDVTTLEAKTPMHARAA